ncbi:uncharacterized protein LOC127084919 isoform X2 [Lathyrus oleraceus]|uniref:uncharacterized protein LOC127084919 isoform X2 n=1 Tax=Pisum sativum TaxID=3888 RepID=UPI0021D1E2FA|nr:uncharacterized protein LOC127084919 isoform X2 [Pisum sativum]
MLVTLFLCWFWWFWQWLVDLKVTHGCRIVAPMAFCRIGGGVRFSLGSCLCSAAGWVICGSLCCLGLMQECLDLYHVNSLLSFCTKEDSAIGSYNYCLHVDPILNHNIHCRIVVQDIVILHMRLGLGFQQGQFATWLRSAFWLGAAGCLRSAFGLGLVLQRCCRVRLGCGSTG